MYPNNPHSPSIIPGLTRGQVAAIAYGAAGLFPGVGNGVAGLGIAIGQALSGGASPLKHENQDVHRN